VDELLAVAADVAVPALFAGVVAILATVAVERFGGMTGGLLSSIPTTIVPFAVGSYARSEDPEQFRRTMAFVPVGILLNALYLLLWRIVPARIGRRTRSHLLLWTMLATLGAWLVVASVVVVAHDVMRPTVPQSLALGIAAFAVGIVLGIAANRTPHPAPKGTHRVGAGVLLARGVAAALVIGFALVLARAKLPVASGIASVFPVIFTTIMVATWLAQGAHVPTGSVGPMALGTLSVSAFALLATVLFPLMPLALAATLAWFTAIACVSVPAFLYLRSRRALLHSAREAAAPTAAREG
jgi:hypothetical protein